MHALRLSTSLILTASLLFSEGPQDKKLPPDKVVGKAMFRIVESSGDGEDATLEPLLIPYFKIARLTGSRPLDKTIMSCEIIKRVVGVEDSSKILMVSTVLKCQGEEFAISEVDFNTEEK